MSLFRDRDYCPTCSKLTGYAGMRAARNPNRAHLACQCDFTTAVHSQGFIPDERVHETRAA